MLRPTAPARVVQGRPIRGLGGGGRGGSTGGWFAFGGSGGGGGDGGKVTVANSGAALSTAQDLSGGIVAQSIGGGGGHGSVKQVHGEADTDGVGYFNFRRNFIVPVVGTDRVQALVLLNVSVEMDEVNIDSAQQREPNIRDAFMKSLLAMSHEGLFNQDITDPDVYSEIQQRLLETAKYSIDESVRSILLVDSARQDQ